MKLKEAFRELLQSTQVSKLEMQRIQGLSAFASQILPSGKLHVHSFARALRRLANMQEEERTHITEEIRADLLWWSNELNLSMTADLWNSEPEISIWTDASNQGFGAHSSSGLAIRGEWSLQESLLHINSKELLAVIKAVESELVPENRGVRVSTDNLPTFFAMKNQGSNKSENLQRLSKQLFLIL